MGFKVNSRTMSCQIQIFKSWIDEKAICVPLFERSRLFALWHMQTYSFTITPLSHSLKPSTVAPL